MAAAWPFGGNQSMAADAAASGSANSYAISDWAAVVAGKGGPVSHFGSDIWNGVSLNAPSIPGLTGDGPFQASWTSFANYKVPEWYQDAKFGIWAHWSPQCVPEDGDWYARKMYIQGEKQYANHLQQYGHPSVSGYKELCAQWTLLNWEPEALMERYKRAGARLFLALANHHDGFDAWNSKYHAWNSTNLGPRKDVIGAWAAAARQQGLRFGVTVHAARNWWWFQVAHLCDKTGAKAGVPYDGRLTADAGAGQWWEGLDPQQLYGRKHGVNENPDDAYVLNFYQRVTDLIEQHDPDLLYFDDHLLPLGWGGMNIAAYFYNHNLKTRGGNMEAILNVKNVPDDIARTVVPDFERGVTDKIMPYPWQSETCIGDWHYNRSKFLAHTYMQPAHVINWMADAVSKNGTFILNIPGKPDGTIDADEQAVLDGIGNWMQTNGEAIYETRPWKVFGEGPHLVAAGKGSGNSTANLDGWDIRFTRNKKGDTVYAIVLGPPDKDITIQNLGLNSAAQPGKVQTVDLLCSAEKLNWNQTSESLTVKKPLYDFGDYAFVLKVRVG